MRLTKFERDVAERIEQSARQFSALGKERHRIAALHAAAELYLGRLHVDREADSHCAADAEGRAKERESKLVAQVDRLQLQVSEAISQLKIKEQEHGVLLRTLVARAASKTNVNASGRLR